MKLVIVWANGDKESIKVTEKYRSEFSPGTKGFSGWVVIMWDSEGREVGGFNMEHARKVWIEE